MNLLDFYKDHIQTQLLPFWQQAIDEKHGGVYTCFDNRGAQRLSTDKYTWSQGRFVWLWSRVADLVDRDYLSGNSAEYLAFAKRTIDFLLPHVFLENGNCAYLLSETGEKKESVAGQGYDTSFYADCFVVLGLAEYARVAKDEQMYREAVRLYDRISERLAEGDVRSEPYPIPVGFKVHSVPMIMLNVTQTLLDAAETLQQERRSELSQTCESYLTEIMDDFYCEEARIAEVLPLHGPIPDSVLCRHVNPGHTIECMWFVMAAAKQLKQPQYIEKTCQTIENAFLRGWDEQYGGLLRFVDRDGGKPRGAQTGDPYEQLILDTWDSKLWWPHSEALYALLLAHQETQNPRFLAYYEKAHEYVFRTFPNPEPQVGEWIQIRDRQGLPMEKVVALPVKDPFHILRNLILIVELLEEKNHG
jgi:N-acylglucosamine 2-epimerase